MRDSAGNRGDDAVPGAVVRRARVDRVGGARAVRAGGARRAHARGDHRGAALGRRCRPAGCRSSICWSAPRARSACRTSCSGRRPTPSSTSPRPSGPTSARPSSTRRWSRSAGASAASAAPASRSAAHRLTRPGHVEPGAAGAVGRGRRLPLVGAAGRCGTQPLGLRRCWCCWSAGLALHEYAAIMLAGAPRALRGGDRGGWASRFSAALYVAPGLALLWTLAALMATAATGAARAPGRDPGAPARAWAPRCSASSTWAAWRRRWRSCSATPPTGRSGCCWRSR